MGASWVLPSVTSPTDHSVCFCNFARLVISSLPPCDASRASNIRNTCSVTGHLSSRKVIDHLNYVDLMDLDDFLGDFLHDLGGDFFSDFRG